MANNKRNVDIIVTPMAGNPGEYEFSMDDGNGKTDKLTFDKTKDGMKKDEDYEIRFKLKNRDGADLKFSRDLGKVLWAEPTTLADPPCPTSQQMQGIFYVKSASDIKDDELIVTNTDPAVQRFIFAFNFLPANEVDGPTANYKLYDPIGDNLNGGKSTQPPGGGTSSFMTVGGAALGALAAFVAMESASATNLVAGGVIGGILGFAASRLLLGGRSEVGAAGG